MDYNEDLLYEMSKLPVWGRGGKINSKGKKQTNASD